MLLLRNTGAIADDASLWPWALLAAGIALAVSTTRWERDALLPVALIVVDGHADGHDTELTQATRDCWRTPPAKVPS